MEEARVMQPEPNRLRLRRETFREHTGSLREIRKHDALARARARPQKSPANCAACGGP